LALWPRHANRHAFIYTLLWNGKDLKELNEKGALQLSELFEFFEVKSKLIHWLCR